MGFTDWIKRREKAQTQRTSRLDKAAKRLDQVTYKPPQTSELSPETLQRLQNLKKDYSESIVSDIADTKRTLLDLKRKYDVERSSTIRAMIAREIDLYFRILNRQELSKNNIVNNRKLGSY